MKQLRNILYCPFGERGNDTAIDRIVHLAGGTDIHIDVLDIVAPAQRHVSRRSLTAMAGHGGRAATPNIDVIVSSGNRADAVIERATEHDYDLVVVTPEDNAGAHHTTKRLVRACPAPLLILRPNPYPNERVLAAVNPMSKRRDLNIEVLVKARQTADILYCELDLVHVWRLDGEQAMRNSGFFQVDREEVEAKAILEREEHRVSLEKMLTDPRVGFEPGQTHFPKGRIGPGVAQVVRQVHASMLVVGSAGRTGWRRLVMGNTAEKMVDAVPCSVLVVR